MTDTLTTQSATPATIPASSIIATDDAGAAGHVQVVKLAVSTDGSATPLTANNTDGLLVNLGSNNDVTVTGTADGAILDGVSSSIKATVLDYTSSNPLAVRLTDTGGDYVGAGAGTQYTEDAVAAADPVGTALNLVRLDTPAAIAADGDNVTARGNSAGAQYVELLSGTAKVGGDATNGLDVDVTRLPALVASSANIGDVDVLTIAAGDNNIGNVDVVTMPIVAVTQSGTWDEVGINDSGNSITVDGTVTATIAAGATTIAKAEDVASADADVGVPAMAVRKATPANVSGTDGDYEFLQVSAGRLWTSATIDAALPAGTAAIGKLAANSGVDIGDVDITSIAAGDNNIGNVDVVTMPTVVVTLAAGAAAIAKAEDVASADADVGVPSMAVRKATPANVSGTDGDYEFLQMSAGRLWASATIDAALPAGTNGIGKLTANAGVTIGAVEIAAAQTLATVTTVSTVTAVTTLTGGGIAHDAADSGNPVKVGAKAVATPSTATMVAAADRVDATADLDSALFVRHVLLGDIITEAISNTDGASTATTNFAATASARNYITALTVFRTDTATTLSYIDFRDGTGGAVLYRVPLPPAGGAVLSNGGEPLFYTTANTALAFDVSTALTTVYISLTGFKSKARA